MHDIFSFTNARNLSILPSQSTISPSLGKIVGAHSYSVSPTKRTFSSSSQSAKESGVCPGVWRTCMRRLKFWWKRKVQSEAQWVMSYTGVEMPRKRQSECVGKSHVTKSFE